MTFLTPSTTTLCETPFFVLLSGSAGLDALGFPTWTFGLLTYCRASRSTASARRVRRSVSSEDGQPLQHHMTMAYSRIMIMKAPRIIRTVTTGLSLKMVILWLRVSFFREVFCLRLLIRGG